MPNKILLEVKMEVLGDLQTVWSDWLEEERVVSLHRIGTILWNNHFHVNMDIYIFYKKKLQETNVVRDRIFQEKRVQEKIQALIK